jgi:hypothetical protein
MHTENKLKEAKYFFNQMKVNLNNPEILGYNLSAFITAARSITYFMQKEYDSTPNFESWYKTKQQEMIDDPVCQFFHGQDVILKPFLFSKLFSILKEPGMSYNSDYL